MANFRAGSSQKSARCMGGGGQILCNQIVDFVTGDGDFGEFADG